MGYLIKMASDMLEEVGEELDVDEKVLDGAADALHRGELPGH